MCVEMVMPWVDYSVNKKSQGVMVHCVYGFHCGKVVGEIFPP